LVLYLIPATDDGGDTLRQLQEVKNMRGDRPLLVVVTKIDLEQNTIEHAIGVSSVTGAGLAELAAEIVRRLIGVPPEPGAAVPFLRESEEALRNARDALTEGNTAAALNNLRSNAFTATR
jgi:tRNA U34 5-carboxymethylaminomethyl modifying GTPase MnmE/TrmE